MDGKYSLYRNTRMPRHGILALSVAFFMSVACSSPSDAGNYSSTIPISPDGYTLVAAGNPASNVHVELYIDITCSDTKVVWKTILEVIDLYRDKVYFQLRMLPLPYHHNAFLISKAAMVVKTYGTDTDIFSFLNYAFEKQADISNKATADMSMNQVIDLIRVWTTANTSITDEQYTTGMTNTEIEMQTRYQVKYGYLKSIYGTPMYVINGVVADSLDGSSMKAWTNCLDPLITLMN